MASDARPQTAPAIADRRSLPAGALFPTHYTMSSHLPGELYLVRRIGTVIVIDLDPVDDTSALDDTMPG